MSKQPFSAKLIRSLEPRHQEYFILDDPGHGGERGLQIRICPSGRKVFAWRRASRGVRTMVTIGDFPEISVTAARNAAQELNYKKTNGRLFPSGHTVTLKGFFEAHYRPKVLIYLAATTQRNYELAWKKTETLHGLRLAEITAAEIAGLHAEIGVDAKSMANTVRAFLSSILHRAVDWEFLEKCPKMPKKFRENRRERYLDKQEVFRLISVLGSYERRYALYFLAVLATGSRRSEVAAMRWDQLDLDHGIWRRIQKGGRRTDTALAAELVIMLRNWRRTIGPQGLPIVSEWVFPSERSNTGHLVNPNKHWKEICIRAELQGITIHGLRHTLATWMSHEGASQHSIQAQLGHQHSSTTAIYTHTSAIAAQKDVNRVFTKMMAGRITPQESA